MTPLSKDNQYGLDLLDGRRLRGLDTFSGIGGLAQALSPWVENLAYCEWKPTSQAILLSRMLRGEIDVAPIWDDIQTLDPVAFEAAFGKPDILVGGFPCQDISNAGKKLGMDGHRSVLYRESLRLAGALRPEYLFFENVSAILARGGAAVIGDLANIGYDARWVVLRAPDADATASHSRERWWCLAHRRDGSQADDGRPLGQQDPQGSDGSEGIGRGPVADADLLGRQDGQPQHGRPGLEGQGDPQSEGRHSPSIPPRDRRQGGSDGRGLGDQSGPGQGWAAPAAEGRPPRPPRPGDAKAWADHLARFPSTQPCLFGDADGLRPDRRDAVGAYGNGVDVVTARVAFRYLLTGVFKPEW